MLATARPIPPTASMDRLEVQLHLSDNMIWLKDFSKPKSSLNLRLVEICFPVMVAKGKSTCYSVLIFLQTISGISSSSELSELSELLELSDLSFDLSDEF